MTIIVSSTCHPFRKLLCLGAMFVLSPFASGQNPEPVPRDVILKAWKARQESTRSARFIWNLTHTYTKGSLSAYLPRKLNPEGLTEPPADHSFDSTASLVFDGDKLMRYRYSWQIWHTAKKSFVPIEIIESFDGNTSKEYQLPNDWLGYPKGCIRREKYCIGVTNMQVRPLLLAYRVSSLDLTLLKLSELVVSGDRPVVNGRTCVVLETSAQARAGYKHIIWVDPEQGYAIVKYMIEQKRGFVPWSVDVGWKQDDKVGWVPSHWRISWLNPGGSVKEFTDAKVVEWALNRPTPLSEFQINFPVGTWVDDSSAYPAPSTHYILRSNDEKRIIDPAELNKPYADLVDGDLGTRTPGRKWVWFAVFLAVPVIVMVFLLTRRRRTNVQQ